MKRHFLQPYLRGPEAGWIVRNDSSGERLAASIVPAFDRKTRNRGLLGLEAFPVGAAMVLAPCSGIHTWFMRFPIDVIFVDRAGRVLRVGRTVAPFRVVLSLRAFAAIELAAGASVGTRVGDMLAVTSSIL
jgi:uncharacterized protein